MRAAAPTVWNRARPIDEMTRNFVSPAFFLSEVPVAVLTPC